MSNGVFCKFDACSSILRYNVASNIWLTLITFDQNTVVATLNDGVFPEFDLAHLGLVVSSNSDTVFMGSLN